jgi:hypothetical protein
VNGVPTAWAKCTLFRVMMASSSAFRVVTMFKVEFSITLPVTGCRWEVVVTISTFFEWCTVLGLHSASNPLQKLGVLELPVDVFNSSLNIGIFRRHPLSQSGFKFMQNLFALLRGVKTDPSKGSLGSSANTFQYANLLRYSGGRNRFPNFRCKVPQYSILRYFCQSFGHGRAPKSNF